MTTKQQDAIERINTELCAKAERESDLILSISKAYMLIEQGRVNEAKEVLEEFAEVLKAA